MAEQGKYLPCKHESHSLDPYNPYKDQRGMSAHLNPSPREAKTENPYSKQTSQTSLNSELWIQRETASICKVKGNGDRICCQH